MTRDPLRMDREEEKRVRSMHSIARANHPHAVPNQRFITQRAVASRALGIPIGRHILGYSNGIALGDAIRQNIVRAEEFAAAQGEVKAIAKHGVWQVPAAERPKGWESMGLREPDAI